MGNGPGGRSARYSAYTGGPDPLAPPVDLREALEHIGRDVMDGASQRRALSELLRRGTQRLPGADRLAAEVHRRRRELLSANNLDGTLAEIKDRRCQRDGQCRDAKRHAERHQRQKRENDQKGDDFNAHR